MAGDFESAFSDSVLYLYHAPQKPKERKNQLPPALGDGAEQAQASEPPESENPPEPIYFPFVPVADILPIAMADRALAVSAMKEFLIELKVPALEAAGTLARLRSAPLMPTDLLAAVQTVKGAEAVISKSFALMQPPLPAEKQAAIIRTMPVTLRRRLAVEVANMLEPISAEDTAAALGKSEGSAAQNPPREPKGFETPPQQ